ncbi:MAG: alpha-L-fucosidase [Saprospiraceae bacterium]|nr:alpha-L-fucosidase [Saprospiraceae bacterium]
MLRSTSSIAQVPRYLSNYKSLYQIDPRAANKQWFEDAHFGLFIHYGLYSQLGKGEWVQFRDTIPV